MVAIWFYVIPQLQTSLYHQRQQDLRRVAVPGSVPLNEAAATNIRTKPLDELVRAVADSADARVTLYGVQRSRGPDKVSWIQSDSHAAPQVDQTTAIANASARSRRVRSGYGRMNGAKVVQTAVPLVYRHRVRWVALYSRALTGVNETVSLIRSGVAWPSSRTAARTSSRCGVTRRPRDRNWVARSRSGAGPDGAG